MLDMKDVEIVSARNGRVRLRTSFLYQKEVCKILENNLKNACVVSNQNTNSITITCKSDYFNQSDIKSAITSLLKEKGFNVKERGNDINILFAFQLMLNVGGGLEGIAFNVAKDIVLDRMGLGAISYFV
jgi:hypothetical protein